VSDSAPSKKDAEKFRAAQAAVAATVERLRDRGVADEDIRRLFEAELGRKAAEGKRGE
jgi:hypothetical protein